MIERIVQITQAEYDLLLAADAQLDALETWGVSNWDGYSDAMAGLAGSDDDESEEDICGLDVSEVLTDIKPTMSPFLASRRQAFLDGK